MLNVTTVSFLQHVKAISRHNDSTSTVLKEDNDLRLAPTANHTFFVSCFLAFFLAFFSLAHRLQRVNRFGSTDTFKMVADQRKMNVDVSTESVGYVGMV